MLIDQEVVFFFPACLYVLHDFRVMATLGMDCMDLSMP